MLDMVLVVMFVKVVLLLTILIQLFSLERSVTQIPARGRGFVPLAISKALISTHQLRGLDTYCPTIL